MSVFYHELRQNRLALIIWTAIISFMLGVAILIYPEMKTQMNEISDMFSNMGSFSDAFGMTELNFGEFIGYFAVECGNVLGMGGAFFAAILGVSALAKEERDRTAEFLLTHPIPRRRIVWEKLLAVFAQIAVLNVAVGVFTLACIAIIGEKADKSVFWMLFAYLLMQFVIAGITFGVSAFVTNGAMGIGIGFAAYMYFLNIIANLTDAVKFLKYLTPFAFADGAYITKHNALEVRYLAVGALFAIVGIAAAFWQYERKDIA